MTSRSFGVYHVVAKVGEGGMGEVYRAHDSRLGRDVAIKTSKQVFDDRFAREVRAVAALNHPNICQVYDVEARLPRHGVEWGPRHQPKKAAGEPRR